MINYDELLAPAAKSMRPSGIRKFFDLAADMPHCISLGVGEPDFKTPWSVRDAGIRSLELGRTKYTANAGLKELRSEICNYLARRFELHYKEEEIRGLGITLSEEQYKAFKERIEKESLQEYLDVKLMDYRELENSKLSFDRIVSVGMIEHVGRPNYDLFFKNVNVVLKESGLFLLHYISGLKESEGDAWIKKYIFPGGVIPSLREIISISSEYKYHILDVESLRLHYKKTLLMWAKNFDNNIDKIKAMFDDKFIRMWRMYLYSCAASFNNGVIDLHQILFVKGVNNNLPMTRSYIYK